MRNDERQGVLVLGANVDEVDVEAVDLGLELRKGVQLRLAVSPVVIRSPVANEFPKLRQLRPLRLICNRLGVGPARRLEAAAEICDVLVGQVRAEGPDGGVFSWGDY